jgi:hypothetical protein
MLTRHSLLSYLLSESFSKPIAGRCELSELIGMSRANLAELEERRVPESDGIRLMGAVDNGKACHFTQSGGASP